MPTPDQEQAFKLHEEFVARMDKEIEDLRERRERPPAALLRETKARIAKAESRLAAVSQERDEALREMEERVASQARTVERLRQAAVEAERRIEESRRPTPDR